MSMLLSSDSLSALTHNSSIVAITLIRKLNASSRLPAPGYNSNSYGMALGQPPQLVDFSLNSFESHAICFEQLLN